MPKTFVEYGLSSEEFGGLVLEDPALFDSYVIRIVEDLDLSAQVIAGHDGLPEIIRPVLEESFRSLERVNLYGGRDFRTLDSAQFDAEPSDGFRSNIQSIVHTYVRGPLAYGPESLDQVTNVVAAVAYDVLSTGGQQAREEGTETVKLRHWLPGCEHWPYPLNRFC
jgi:hypothetical protein